MNGANETFEKFASAFAHRYGYLPLGKDDPCRPGVETVLADLASTFRELQAKESSPPAPNSAMVPCPLHVDPELSACPVFGGECGREACMIQRAQHQ